MPKRSMVDIASVKTSLCILMMYIISILNYIINFFTSVNSSLRYYLRNIIFIFCINFLATYNAQAVGLEMITSVIKEMGYDALQQTTCELGKLAYDLIEGTQSHTCVPDMPQDTVVRTVATLGRYGLITARLRMNDQYLTLSSDSCRCDADQNSMNCKSGSGECFLINGSSSLGDNCSRLNKVSYYNQYLDFGLCSTYAQFACFMGNMIQQLVSQLSTFSLDAMVNTDINVNTLKKWADNIICDKNEYTKMFHLAPGNTITSLSGTLGALSNLYESLSGSGSSSDESPKSSWDSAMSSDLLSTEPAGSNMDSLLQMIMLTQENGKDSWGAGAAYAVLSMFVHKNYYFDLGSPVIAVASMAMDSPYTAILLQSLEMMFNNILNFLMIPAFPVVVLDAEMFFVQQIQDMLCVVTPMGNTYTQLAEFFIALPVVPVGCKLITEPYPYSAYSYSLPTTGQTTAKTMDFLDGITYAQEVEYTAPSGSTITVGSQNSATYSTTVTCDTLWFCGAQGAALSHAGLNVTGPMFNCIRNTILLWFNSSKICNVLDITSGSSTTPSTESQFRKVQKLLSFFVSSMLAFYTLFFGLRIVLGGGVDRGEASMAIFKICFVAFCAIGATTQENQYYNGVVDYIMPLLFGAMTQGCAWMINAINYNSLCLFDSSEYLTVGSDGVAVADISMMIWDSIDCRLEHYLGVDGLIESALRGNGNRPDNMMSSIPPYIFFLIPAVLFGMIPLAMTILTYPILIMSFVGYVVSLFAMAMMNIAVLCLLAPLFVPMCLFKRTEGWFHGWCKVLIASALQPTIAMVFVALAFGVQDRAFFGTCTYVPVIMTYGGSTTSHYKKFFYLSEDDQTEDCVRSLGYTMNRVMKKFVTVINWTAAVTTATGESVASGSINDVVRKKDSIHTKVADYSNVGGSEDAGIVKLPSSSSLMTEMFIGLIVCCLSVSVMQQILSGLNSYIGGLVGVGTSGKDARQSLTKFAGNNVGSLSNNTLAGLASKVPGLTGR